MLLSDKDRQQLLIIIASTLHTPVEVWAYGNRVNGDAHDTSDLDLVIRTEDLSPVDSEQWTDLMDALDASNIPILIQVFDWARLPESFHQALLQGYEVLQEIGENGNKRV